MKDFVLVVPFLGTNTRLILTIALKMLSVITWIFNLCILQLCCKKGLWFYRALLKSTTAQTSTWHQAIYRMMVIYVISIANNHVEYQCYFSERSSSMVNVTVLVYPSIGAVDMVNLDYTVMHAWECFIGTAGTNLIHLTLSSHVWTKMVPSC